MKPHFFFAFAFALLLTKNTAAKTYKVTSDQEMKQISKQLAPGDDVVIANGNYSNWVIQINAKGTQGAPIVIRAENAGKVIFSGDVDSTVFKLSGSYVQLKGLTFKACQLNKKAQQPGILVELKNSFYCRISGCVFQENSVKAQFMPLVIISGNGESNRVDSCSFLSNLDNQDLQVKVTKESFPKFTLIERNRFSKKRPVSWKNGNGGECIQIGQDPVLLGNQAPQSIVRENRFEECNGESEVISNKSSSNSYLNNYFRNNHGELVMRGGHDCIISDNIFEGGSGGIRVNGSGHTLSGNKLTGIKTAIRLMYGMAKGKNEIGFYIAASGCKITNNMISNAETGILIGDGKDTNWTGKFDVSKYPSPVFQSIAPFDNQLSGNSFSNVKVNILKR